MTRKKLLGQNYCISPSTVQMSKPSWRIWTLFQCKLLVIDFAQTWHFFLFLKLIERGGGDYPNENSKLENKDYPNMLPVLNFFILNVIFLSTSIWKLPKNVLVNWIPRFLKPVFQCPYHISRKFCPSLCPVVAQLRKYSQTDIKNQFSTSFPLLKCLWFHWI